LNGPPSNQHPPTQTHPTASPISNLLHPDSVKREISGLSHWSNKVIRVECILTLNHCLHYKQCHNNPSQLWKWIYPAIKSHNHGFLSPLEHALLVSVVGCHFFHIFSTFTGLLLEFKHVITISHDPAL
jgi:hypothetical protein